MERGLDMLGIMPQRCDQLSGALSAILKLGRISPDKRGTGVARQNAKERGAVIPWESASVRRFALAPLTGSSDAATTVLGPPSAICLMFFTR